MNVLLVGGEFVNKGSEAMVLTAQAELERRLGRLHLFYVPGRVRGTDRAFETHGIRPLAPRTRKSHKLVTVATLALRNPTLLSTAYAFRNVTCLCDLARLDGIIDVSGYAYGDTEWGSRRIPTTVGYARYSRILGVPYIFLPQAFGPFRDVRYRELFAAAFANSALVVCRDQQSYEMVESVLNGNTANVRTCVDIAFKFQAASPDKGLAVLNRLGLEGERTFGLFPNAHIYKKSAGTGTTNEYVRILAGFAQALVRRGYSVLLLPHEIDTRTTEAFDDRSLGRLVECLAGDRRVRSVSDPLTAGEIKAVVGQLYAVISSRFHALVAALSQCVPAASVGWSHKYIELLRPFGLEHLVISHEDINEHDIRRIVDDLVTNRGRFATQIKDVIPGQHTAVDDLFDLVASILVRQPLNGTTVSESGVPRRGEARQEVGATRPSMLRCAQGAVMQSWQLFASNRQA